MEVRSGFKQTEMGLIPKDWEAKKLGDLNPFVTSGSRGWAAFYSEFGSPFIRITNLSRRSIYLDLADLRFVNLAPNESEAIRTQLRDEDVLISITADIGIIGYVSASLPKPAFINQHIALMRFDPTQANPKFVSYSLAAEKPQRFFRALTDAGAKAGINLTTVQEIQLALPPTKAEQEAIAEALSNADALIEALEQLLVKKRNLKQGAMQELLTGRTRLPGFSGKWELKAFNDVCWFQEGPGVRNTQFTTSGVKLLNGTNIFRGVLNLSSTSRFISKGEAYGAYAHFLADAGDIVIASSGITIDRFHEKVAFVRDYDLPFCMNTSTIRFKPFVGLLDPKFLFHILTSEAFKRAIGGQATGSAQLNFGPSHVAKVFISVPQYSEQEAIAAILSDMDTEIAALDTKLIKARDLKQGMMQELLTGRIRLV
jgi:type I restriction enzyme S subunit